MKKSWEICNGPGGTPIKQILLGGRFGFRIVGGFLAILTLSSPAFSQQQQIPCPMTSNYTNSSDQGVNFSACTINSGVTFLNNPNAFFTSETEGVILATISNFGTIQNNANASFVSESILDSAGTITNSGTFSSSGTLGNEGTITGLSGGSINIASSFTNFGGATVTNDAGSMLHFADGDIENNSGATISNIGALVSDPNVRLTSDGSLFNLGTFTSTGEIINNGIFVNSTGATLTSTVPQFGLSTSGVVTNNGTLSNLGSFSSGGDFNNAGTFDNGMDATWMASGRISNSGTINNFGAAIGNDNGITNASNFNNFGSMSFFGSFENQATAALLNAAGATMTSLSLNNEGTLTNKGAIKTADISTNTGLINNEMGATLTNGDQFFNLGTINNDVGATIIIDGFLTNSGTISNDGEIDNNSTFINNGTVTNKGGGTFINGAGAAFANNGTFTTVGSFNNNGVLTNTVAAMLSIGQGAALTNNGIIMTPGTISNSGAFNNADVLDIQAGGVLTDLAGSSFAQTGGQTIVDGTVNSASALQIQHGILSGGGTINGDVSNSGNLHPMSGAGAPVTLTINGDYTQGPDGMLTIDLSGNGPGDFSVLDITGSAELGGAVDFAAVGGFTPTAGDSFTFLLFGDLDLFSAAGVPTSDFADMLFTDWACPVDDTCSDVFSSDSVTLEITGPTATPEPSTMLLLGIGMLALAGCSWKKRAISIA